MNEDAAAMREALLAWYDAHRRDLPWRRTHDPYAILVSEVMLQQTRVETVVRRYAAWLERFGSLAALAEATDDEVMAEWSGLGYYRRARALHAAAKAAITLGGLPSTAEDLRRLPGVGAYTAAAVASIAFGEPVAAVDGNVQRVMARLACIESDVGQVAGAREVSAAATRCLDPGRPGDWNQAVMELGATVCTPRPRCARCPVAAWCDARRQGKQAMLPRRTHKRPPREQAMHFAVIERRGRVLLVKRPDDGMLAGTWGLPGGPVEIPLATHVEQQAGLHVRVRPSFAEAEHRFTHRTWRMRVHQADATGTGSVRGQWVARDGLHRIGLSAAMRRALATVPEMPEQGSL